MTVIDRIKSFIRQSPRAATLVLVALVGIGACLYYFLKPAPENKKDFRNVAVEVEEVRLGSLTRTITAVGTLMANQTVTVRPEVNGLIAKIHVDGGEYVEKESPLFEIDDRVFQAELKESQAKLEFAKVEFNRAKSLAEKSFGSAQKLDDARAKMLMAEAAVESAKAKLERTVIRAPFEGIVGLHTLSIGSQVGPDKEILTLVDITPIKIDFKIPAEYLRFISVGQRVDVTIDGFGTKKFTALIAGIDSKVDPTAHSINVRALMPNKNNIFKPGLFARVDIVVGSKDNTLIIPEVAIEASGDQDMVYKVVEGLAFQVPILTGIREGENVEVLRGLNANDHVVIVGQSKIRDGTPVRYELNGQIYAFNEAEFKKKQQEMEDRKKQDSEESSAESTPASSVKEHAGNAAKNSSTEPPQESNTVQKPSASTEAAGENVHADAGKDTKKTDATSPQDQESKNKEPAPVAGQSTTPHLHSGPDKSLPDSTSQSQPLKEGQKENTGMVSEQAAKKDQAAPAPEVLSQPAGTKPSTLDKTVVAPQS